MSDVSGMSWRVAEGVLRFTFDRPGEKVNVLTPALLREIDRLLVEHAARPEVTGILFDSDKPGNFLAGMDVEAIGAVTDPRLATDVARAGQAAFRRIAEARVPSVAAINGTCLGGGTELALACTFRVAVDDPSLRIGLPEVQLGIIPGFGGTQRLPRLVGLPNALDLILTGRRIDARRAAKMGLVDRVVPAAYLERESLTLLARARERGVETTARAERRPRPLLWRAVEAVPFLRRRVIEQARKKAAANAAQRHYPAPYKALEAIEAAYARPMLQGLDLEARLVGELATSPTAKNLIWIFRSQTALKGAEARPPAAPRRVERAAVLGAGIMGGGIARLLADADLPVRLRDVRYPALLQALETAQGLWRKEVERRRLKPHELDQKMAWIAPTLELTGFAHVDLVIEAVVEDLEVKQRVLAEVEQRIGERAVFASNTSSLPIGDIAARALRPERVVGMHFFNPVHRMPLVEVIAGRRSSPEAVATIHALAVRLGKVPVIVRDGPGFLVNRILGSYLDEAMRLLADGVDVPTIDGAMTAFGMPVGPLALLDQVGLDTARHVGRVLAAAFPERAGADAGLLDRMVDSGRLGQKNGRGFWRWKDGKRLEPDPKLRELVGAKGSRQIPPETLQERMVLALVNESARALGDEVVREPRELDVAMVMGTGFPPFRGGVLRHADSLGIPVVVDRLSRLADAHGERFRPAELLRRMVREERAFYGPEPRPARGTQSGLFEAAGPRTRV